MNGTVDLVVATYTINDKRKERIAFAGPYYEAGQNIMVRKDETAITGPDSFKDGTKKVCSVTGSTPAEEIKKYVKDVGTQLVLFDTYDKCRDALQEQAGRRRHHRQRDPARLHRQGRGVLQAGRRATSPRSRTASVCKKEDTDFRNFINDTLDKAVRDGSWKKAWDDTAGKFGAALGTRADRQPLLIRPLDLEGGRGHRPVTVLIDKFDVFAGGSGSPSRSAILAAIGALDPGRRRGGRQLPSAARCSAAIRGLPPAADSGAVLRRVRPAGELGSNADFLRFPCFARVQPARHRPAYFRFG